MDKITLGDRLDGIGFASFFIMLGILWLQPEGHFPEDTWLIGLAAIIYTISIIKASNGIKVDCFFLFMATVALAFGIDEFFNIELHFFPMIFIFVGIFILWEIFFGEGEFDWSCCDESCCDWWKKKK